MRAKSLIIRIELTTVFTTKDEESKLDHKSSTRLSSNLDYKVSLNTISKDE